MRKMEAEVGLVHGCRRVMRHRWMTVYAIHLAAGGGKEIAENNKPAQMRRGNNNRYSLGGKYRPSNLECSPNAAPVRRRVESGANLIVRDLRREFAHARENSRQMGRHPLR